MPCKLHQRRNVFVMQSNRQFPLDEARELVKGLYAPNPWIYWTDFLFSVTLGWGSFFLALRAPAFSAWQGVFYLAASLALYRAVIFTHELAHLRKSTFRVFRLVWNLTCGFPLMVPSYMYGGVHNDHHKRKVYGTHADGEYLPFAVTRPIRIVLYLLQVFVLPVLLAGRFIVLTPLSYLNGGLRRLLWTSASSLTIDYSYRRPEPSSRDEAGWRWQEFATFLYGAAAVSLVISGLWPWRVLLLWYLVSVLMFVLNSLRTLAAHRYRNPGGRPMEFAEQYLDSVNVPGNRLFTTLWAPVGLRYHATHHLFPALPYHALGAAHRRLVRELPDNRLYLQTLRSGLWDALQRLWRESRSHPRAGAPTTLA